MKINAPNNTTRALTQVEVIVAIFIVFVLAILILPALTRARPRKKAVNCVSNHKQIGLAFRMWSSDHDEKFPWQVSISKTGTLEFAESPDVFRHFLAVSNEMSSPKVLACNSDAKISKASQWSDFNNSSLSYFVGLDSNEASPETILCGDRNITGGMLSSNGIRRFDSRSAARWGPDMHGGVGNIGLADGSALQVTDRSLRKQIQAALLSTNVAALRFSVPKPNQYP